MISMNLSSLVGALDETSREALEEAAGACVSRGGFEIGIDDYMEKLLATQEMTDIFTQFDRSLDTMRGLLARTVRREASTSRPVFSPILIGFLQEAYLLASLELRQDKVGVGELVLALLLNPARYGAMPFYQELGQIPGDALRRLLDGLREGRSGPAGSRESNGGGGFLEKYATDFTADARAGRTDPVFARGPEIRMMIDILTRRRKNNPILVGDPGVGKTAVVEGLALRVVEGLVPDALTGVRIVGLDMGRLQAGASVKGEFEKRLKGVIDEVKAAPVPTILFIDEAHTLVGAGNAPGAGDGANLLKPALARGEMRTIAATTWSEYKKYFEKDAALARRFQLVKLDEPSVEETVTILRGIVPHYEKSHNVYVRDDAILCTAELSCRYLSGRRLPDKAIDVLDTACARVRVSHGAKPLALEALEEELASVRRELDALERDFTTCGLETADPQGSERHAGLRGRVDQLVRDMEVLAGRWTRERGLVESILGRRNQPGGQDCRSMGEDTRGLVDELHIEQAGQPLVFHEVTPALVRGIVSEWTGIPVSKLGGDGAGVIERLGEDLRRRVRGQDFALQTIERTVLAAQVGLNSPTRPTGIFLLVGPSGVGKTETALAVADTLFGGSHMLVCINMSEFQEKHTVSRLIGSPPGYVGFGEGGRLTEAVRRQPYCAVLFDEVEKAHPEVLNLFYQIFDKGMLADGEGREVDFRNCVIFMTSNIGGDIVSALCEEDEAPDPEALKEALRPALLRHFQPALLGRMTVVPYTSIRGETLRELVEMKLAKVKSRLAGRHRINLHWEEEVAASIMASCTAVETGARNIDHIIGTSLLPGIATTLLGALGENGNPCAELRVGLNRTDGAFTFELGGRS
jgi:type VI secretion system protein VasG